MVFAFDDEDMAFTPTYRTVVLGVVGAAVFDRTLQSTEVSRR